VEIETGKPIDKHIEARSARGQPRAGAVSVSSGSVTTDGLPQQLGIGVGPAAGAGAKFLAPWVAPADRAPAAGALAAAGAARAPEPRESNRVSNGLKNSCGISTGLARDSLGPRPGWQTTLSFFIERGFRFFGGILRAWKISVEKKENCAKPRRAAQQHLDVHPGPRRTFLEANCNIRALRLSPYYSGIARLLEPWSRNKCRQFDRAPAASGVVFAMFTARSRGFQRYRVVDPNTLQVISSPFYVLRSVSIKTEIQDLFSRYRTVKSFVGRDQLREFALYKVNLVDFSRLFCAFAFPYLFACAPALTE